MCMSQKMNQELSHDDKLLWMTKWCQSKNITLQLAGECGFGRECVGILVRDEAYPDYEWYNETTWEREDNNGDVWTPDDAYHKHPCVAVLGRGEQAEAQLYEWLKWFDDNDFTVVIEDNPNKNNLHIIEKMMGKDTFKRMVRRAG